jgi:ABC-type uncharacterized transport system substrate-binding protein
VRTTRRLLIRSVAVCAVLTSARVLGQQTNRLPRVALVFGSTPVADMIGTDPASPYARAFIHGLRDLGLVEGRNIIIERRSTEGRPERMLALMQEVVALDVDVIVTIGRGVRVAQRATDRIAIVGLVDEALDGGLIDNLVRPGRNLTGIDCFGEPRPSGSGRAEPPLSMGGHFCGFTRLSTDR